VAKVSKRYTDALAFTGVLGGDAGFNEKFILLSGSGPLNAPAHRPECRQDRQIHEDADNEVADDTETIPPSARHCRRFSGGFERRTRPRPCAPAAAGTSRRAG